MGTVLSIASSYVQGPMTSSLGAQALLTAAPAAYSGMPKPHPAQDPNLPDTSYRPD